MQDLILRGIFTTGLIIIIINIPCLYWVIIDDIFEFRYYLERILKKETRGLKFAIFYKIIVMAPSLFILFFLFMSYAIFALYQVLFVL